MVLMSFVSACANTLAGVLFLQSLWVGLKQVMRNQPLVPPVAPLDGCMSKGELARSETQLAISKAVHPHLHAADGKTAKQCARGSSKIASSWVYTHTIPYASTYLAFVQALLGLCTTLVMLVWQLWSLDGCSQVAVFALSMFHIGLALVFIASAVQTHTVNSMCVKIFFIVGLALGAHFTMLGLVVTRSTATWQPLCTVDIGQPQGWLSNLPLYAAISHFLASFFSSISFINGAFRLCTRSHFLSPREILFVFLVYRGIGLLFISSLVGVMASTVVIIVSVTGHFHFALWVLQWAVISRLLVGALEHRGTTDTMASDSWFWRSQQYLANYINTPDPQDNNKNNGALATAKIAWVLLSSNVVAKRFSLESRNVEQLDCSQDLHLSTEHLSIVIDSYATGTSRHDTVVDDSSF
ncbi:hypothetical protein GGI25_004315 [Coemansia spiralis]|uniref:Uncharacterized protein n=2 Tax=Coemansia TaxID=4863 RepID=A0A9W8G5D7_9FUNG|nr:hypothetical protein GGI25_004315 [Coemansia spiralis]